MKFRWSCNAVGPPSLASTYASTGGSYTVRVRNVTRLSYDTLLLTETLPATDPSALSAADVAVAEPDGTAGTLSSGDGGAACSGSARPGGGAAPAWRRGSGSDGATTVAYQRSAFSNHDDEPEPAAAAFLAVAAAAAWASAGPACP